MVAPSSRTAGAQRWRVWIALGLVTAAYSACGPSLPSTEPLGGKEILPDAGDDAAAGDAGQEAGDAATAAPSSQPNPVEPPPPAETPVVDAGSDAPGDSGSTPSDGGADAASSASKTQCDDSKGTPGSCSDFAGPAGKPCFGAIGAKLMCKQLSQALRPKVAETLVKCLESKNGTAEICEQKTLMECAKGSLDAACPRPEMKPICESILSSCSAPTDEQDFWNQDICEKGLSAVKEPLRDAFVACVRQKCSLGRCMSELVKN